MENYIVSARKYRPTTFESVVGQQALTQTLRNAIRTNHLAHAYLFCGPRGVGKTTCARIFAKTINCLNPTAENDACNQCESCAAFNEQRSFNIHELDAASNNGVDDIRALIDQVRIPPQIGKYSVYIIDEVHMLSAGAFNALLKTLEEPPSYAIFILATTEKHKVLPTILSRCQVYVLKSLGKEDLLELLHRALTEDEHIRALNIEVKETDSILRYSGGDARKLLNIIELVTNSGVRVIDNETVTKQLQQNPVAYDKDGELHYDIISAFIKSIRGSAPDAALYWLARMVAAGEDPKFIARRLVISASEDIGLANPNAMLVANACFDTLQKIGWPEGRIPLAMATVYLATSQKSNSAYLAINHALELVEKTGNLPVPLHLRNAPTKLMDELGYGQDYQYAHDFPNHFVKQQFMPDALQGTQLWYAQGSPQEQKMAEWMKYLWEDKK